MIGRMLAKRTSKNQITLPQQVADQFAGTDYFEVTTEEGKIVLQAADVRSLHSKLQEIGIDESEIGEAVAWARNTANRSSRADLYARAAESVGSFRLGDGTADLSVRHDEYLDQAYR